jgi:hypothetical protein
VVSAANGSGHEPGASDAHLADDAPAAAQRSDSGWLAGVADGSRRALLARGALVGGALLGLAGCAGPTPTTTTVTPGPLEPAQVVVLNSLRALELEAIHIYEAGVPVLGSAPFAAYGSQFLQDAIVRSADLAALVVEHGGRPTNVAATGLNAAPSSRIGVLELFASLQRRQIRLYLRSIPKATPGTTRAALGAMLGSVAQQLALVRRELGQPPLASPFVSGS